jgi:hypothetical protein
MFSSLLFAVVLLATSGLMISWHVISWRRKGHANLDERARDFYRRQYRRRMQTSAMIGFLGIAVAGGVWIREPRYALAYWGCVTIVVVWMGLLALADLLSTRAYFAQIRRDQLTEHASLQAELRRIREREGKGRAEEGAGAGGEE